MNNHPYHQWLDTLPFTTTPLAAVCQYHDVFNAKWAYNADQMLLTYKDKKSYLDLRKAAYCIVNANAYECFLRVLERVLPAQQLVQLRSYVYADPRNSITPNGEFARPIQGFFISDRLLPLSLSELDYITTHEYDRRPFFDRSDQTVFIDRNKYTVMPWYIEKADYKISLPTQLNYCFFPESATAWVCPSESRGITPLAHAAKAPEFSSVEDLFL